MKIAIFACATALVLCGCGRVCSVPASQRVKGDMHAMSSVVKMYKINNGHFPSTAQGLRALVVKPTGDPEPMSWTQLADRIPTDPWGQEYRYEYLKSADGEERNDQFRIISVGEDGSPGTEDDLAQEYPLR